MASLHCPWRMGLAGHGSDLASPARLWARPGLLLGGTTGAEGLPARRRRVKASLCAMMIHHLLPGLTPDAGFNLPWPF